MSKKNEQCGVSTINTNKKHMKKSNLFLLIGLMLCISCLNPKQKPVAFKPIGPDETALSTGKTLIKEFKLSDQERLMIDNADLKNLQSFNCETMCCNAIAFSVTGNCHVSNGIDIPLEYSIVITDEGQGWAAGAPVMFVAPCNGLYFFTIDFVKDSYYNNGTTDDVAIDLIKVPSGSSSGWYVGDAWSGEGAGSRGTGTYNVVLRLNFGDKVYTKAHSDGGLQRHIIEYHFSGFSIGK
jgi:hypothetical protein